MSDPFRLRHVWETNQRFGIARSPGLNRVCKDLKDVTAKLWVRDEASSKEGPRAKDERIFRWTLLPTLLEARKGKRGVGREREREGRPRHCRTDGRWRRRAQGGEDKAELAGTCDNATRGEL